MRVLTVNAGSSSVKLRLVGAGDELLEGVELPARGSRFDVEEVSATVRRWCPRVDAVGHRVVHGGRDLLAAVPLDAAVRARLAELADLAPLHQPKSLAGIDAVTRALPEVPAVACFDTAFHAGLPAAAATYPLPAPWRDRYGLHRYGFHGLAHAWATRRAGALLGGVPDRLVVCHLGSGASLAAVHRGASVDTTMGFTPLDGLVMATRPGSLDPGLVLWLAQHAGIPLAELADALEHRSGLAALAGTADMRQVLAAAEAGQDRARLALAVYLHRLRAGIAAMAAALGGLDALAFSGGVGEHAPAIRAGAAAGLGFLGIAVDADRNAAASGDAEITTPGAAVRTLVVTAREDLEIADQVRGLLRGTHQEPPDQR
jgi:acetate kinase